MLNRNTLILVGTVILNLGIPLMAAQPVDSSLTFQGQLKQAGKSVDDSCDMHVGLWDAGTNGILVATNSFVNVDVVDGLFTLNLDFGQAAFMGDARWLEIAVDCPAGMGAFETLSPRQPLTAAPYALHALNGGAGGGDGHSLDAADGSPVDALFVDNDGNVGIGTTTPQLGLDVFSGAQDRARIGQLEIGGWPLNPAAFCYLGNQSLDQTVNGNYALIQGNTGQTILNSAAGQSLFLSIGNAIHSAVLTPTGNFGIGTNSPTSKLQVHDGQLRFTGPSGTFMLNGSNDPTGPPVGDAFRFIYDANYFGANLDTLVIEKTDGNGLEPDGGIAFVNTGSDNIQDPALVIRGNGRVGVQTNDPDQDFTVNGQANITGNTGIGVTSPTARVDVTNSGVENVARFRNNAFNLFNPTTALSKVTVLSSAQMGLGTPVQSNLTLESESTTGGGQNVVRIRAEDRALEIISADRLDVVTDGPIDFDLGGLSTFSITEGFQPNIIAGTAANSISLGFGSTIGGGGDAASGFDPPGTHLITDHNCTISGGAANQAGNNNGDASDARNATVSGGVANIASGRGSTVGGGRFNTASGLFSTVPGGFNSQANATCSLAAGCQARANHSGSFVWADAFPTNTGPSFGSSANNQFNVRANGGVRFASSTHASTGAILAGVQLAPGGSGWGVLSDRNAKENFESVDGDIILKKLAAVPMQTWNYKSQNDNIRHIGPMAQDFHSAFGVGEDNRHINTIDADGVALAAAQALHHIVEQQNRQIDDLTARIKHLESVISSDAFLANRGGQ